MSADAGRELARALKRRAGDGVAIVAARMVDWGALLFEGHRHEITLTMPAARAADFVAGIGETEFLLGDHIVADIVVIGSCMTDGIASVEVEALTLLDRRPCCDDAGLERESHEGHEGHKGHKGHDRCGLRLAAEAMA